MLIERWRRPSMLSSMCQHVARLPVWQLCRERQPFWNSHDGLNLTCLDQCHGVRSHGTNSRFAQESLPTEACLCGHQCFSVVAQATAKIRPRPVQEKKEFHEQLYKATAQMNADWKVEKAQYAEFNVPTCGKIAVWQLCRERHPFWNSHDGLNLACLDQCHGVRWLPPKNRYTVYSLDLIDEFTSLFSPKVIVAGLLRESFPNAFVDITVFLWWRTKILPRLAQGLFSNERTW